MAVVNHRDAFHVGCRDERRQGTLPAAECGQRGALGLVHVVVGGVTHDLIVALGFLVFRAVQDVERGDRLMRTVDAVYQVEVERHAVVQVKARREVRLVLAFREEQQLMRGDRAQTGDGLLPEVGRDEVGRVAAVAVDVRLEDPVAHRVDHGLAHVCVVVVEGRHVEPPGLGWADDVAGVVLLVPRLVGDPRVVPGRVVRHPVKQHDHLALVRFLHQRAQVGQGAELVVDPLVVAHAVG